MNRVLAKIPEICFFLGIFFMIQGAFLPGPKYNLSKEGIIILFVWE